MSFTAGQKKCPICKKGPFRSVTQHIASVHSDYGRRAAGKLPLTVRSSFDDREEEIKFYKRKIEELQSQIDEIIGSARFPPAASDPGLSAFPKYRGELEEEFHGDTHSTVPLPGPHHISNISKRARTQGGRRPRRRRHYTRRS